MSEFVRKCIAGIDIGGTNVRCAVADAAAPEKLLNHTSTPTPHGISAGEFVVFLVDRVREVQCATGGGSLVGVGCVAPGIIDVQSGLVLSAANLDWRDVPLRSMLAEAFGVPVAIENDVNAAAIAESEYGAGRGTHSVVYLTVSTGVAVGIVIEGRLIRGFHHAAGEIGFFMPGIEHIGTVWGENGCLELTAAGIGLARAWARQTGEAGATAQMVFDAARAGDPQAQALVDRAADYLAEAVVALATILDPEVLVLGGSIALNEPELYHRLREVTQKTLPNPLKIVPSVLSGDAPLVGASILAARLQRGGG